MKKDPWHYEQMAVTALFWLFPLTLIAAIWTKDHRLWQTAVVEFGFFWFTCFCVQAWKAKDEADKS